MSINRGAFCGKGDIYRLLCNDYEGRTSPKFDKYCKCISEDCIHKRWFYYMKARVISNKKIIDYSESSQC